MLLYLTGMDSVNLLDFVENESGMIPKKMTGKFSLLQFVIRDMRNYAHVKYFVIDKAAVSEDEAGFIEAIASFQTMFIARVIVICEGYSEHDPFIRQLVMTGVTDIVTAADIKEIQAEILECLSPEGMQRYKVPAQKPQSPTIAAKRSQVSERYIFTCKDIRIAIAGCQRRVGVTTTSVNLAHWIQAHGGTACYLESNLNKHLAYILKLYADQSEGNHYTIGDVDYYFTNELDKTYNFIITDCGKLDEPPQASFAEADLRLLCGSAMPYELVHMQNALKRCKGMNVQTLGIYVPLDIRELVQDAICDDMLFADPSHELFDGNANGNLNKKLVKEYMTGIMDNDKAAQRA